MECLLALIFVGFWWIWGTKLGGKWSQNRSKKASKKRCKKEGHQDGQKVAIRRSAPTPGDRLDPRSLGGGRGRGKLKLG